MFKIHVFEQQCFSQNSPFVLHSTDVLASFQYWAYGTITGFTGIILTLIVIVMYVFATPYARRNLFNAFWVTHSFYILLYIFMVMHGTGRLVQPPLFQNYFYGPLFIFIVDKFISLSRNQVEIDVISADLLPSGKKTMIIEYSYDNFILCQIVVITELNFLWLKTFLILTDIYFSYVQIPKRWK